MRTWAEYRGEWWEVIADRGEYVKISRGGRQKVVSKKVVLLESDNSDNLATEDQTSCK